MKTKEINESQSPLHRRKMIDGHCATRRGWDLGFKAEEEGEANWGDLGIGSRAPYESVGNITSQLWAERHHSRREAEISFKGTEGGGMLQRLGVRLE